MLKFSKVDERYSDRYWVMYKGVTIGTIYNWQLTFYFLQTPNSHTLTNAQDYRQIADKLDELNARK